MLKFTIILFRLPSFKRISYPRMGFYSNDQKKEINSRGLSSQSKYS